MANDKPTAKVNPKNPDPTMQVSLNLDTTSILYTDNISITTNQDGVVLDIMQRVGPTNQMRVVARIGMSREHAKKFVSKLAEMLAKAEGRVETGKKIIN